MKTMDGSKMSDSMNSEYDAVFTKKSFDQIDNSDMKTLVVDKIEFLTRLCHRMHEKIVLMEYKMEKNQEDLIKKSWQEHQNENDFRDVTLACDDNQIGAHKVVINQDKLVKNLWQEQQFENDFRDATMACDDDRIGTHKVILKSQDDLLKYSSDEDLMERRLL